MAECEVPVLCEITEFEPSSNKNENEKETIHEEVNGEENEKETIHEEVNGEENEKGTVDEEVNVEENEKETVDEQDENEKETVDEQDENEKETIHEEVNGEENEKETVDEEVNVEDNEKETVDEQDENQTVDGISVIIDDDKNEEEGIEDSDDKQKGNVDWMDEYPPLVSSYANYVGRNTLGWLDILKKPHKLFDEERSDISIEESIASSSSVGMQDVLKKPNWPIDLNKSESVASSEVCSTDGNRATSFLVKLPRFDDEILEEQIELARLHLDEKTSSRDATRALINRTIEDNEFAHVVDEVKTARELVKMKRKEIDSHLSIIRVVKKNTSSFDDMNSQEAFEQQSEAEEYLKTLKKELNSLKASVLRAETSAAVVQKKRQDGEKKVRALKDRLRVENDACQAAYARLRTLKIQLQDKTRQFYGHRVEATADGRNANSKITEALCKNQVERFVKMWNTNKEFRQDYVKSNAKSTVRRFQTLDGRSLGRDEKPVMLPPRRVSVVNIVQKEKREENDHQGISTEVLIIRNDKDDVRNEVSRKPEEMELKEEEQKLKVVEANEVCEADKLQMEADKREKKRLKRLRLKERKKAAARLVGSSEEPLSEVVRRAKDLDLLKETQQVMDQKEQATSLEEHHPEEMERQLEEHHLEENEPVLAVEVTEETKKKEGEDELEELQGQIETTSDEALTREETAAADEVIEQQRDALMEQMRAEIKAELEAKQRDKNREKNLRKKERKKQMKNAPPTKSFASVVIIVLIIIIILLILFTLLVNG